MEKLKVQFVVLRDFHITHPGAMDHYDLEPILAIDITKIGEITDDPEGYLSWMIGEMKNAKARWDSMPEEARFAEQSFSEQREKAEADQRGRVAQLQQGRVVRVAVPPRTEAEFFKPRYEIRRLAEFKRLHRKPMSTVHSLRLRVRSFGRSIGRTSTRVRGSSRTRAPAQSSEAAPTDPPPPPSDRSSSRPLARRDSLSLAGIFVSTTPRGEA